MSSLSVEQRFLLKEALFQIMKDHYDDEIYTDAEISLQLKRIENLLG